MAAPIENNAFFMSNIAVVSKERDPSPVIEIVNILKNIIALTEGLKKKKIPKKCRPKLRWI